MVIKYTSLIIGAIFEIYCINKFIKTFSPNIIEEKIKFKILFGLLSLAHIIISVSLSGISLAISAIVIVFFFNQLYKSKQYIKIIVSISISVINISSELLLGGLFMFLTGDSYLQISNYPEAYAIGVLSSKFLVFLIVTIVEAKKVKISVSYLTFGYRLLLCVLPITTIILSILMYQVMLVIYSSGIKITFVIANVLLIVSNVITFEIINKQNQLAKSEWELKFLKNNIKEQTKHYEALASSQEEIRKLRHDMKNTYLGVISALKSGKYTIAYEQLQKDLNIVEKSSKVLDTGYPVLDTVIESKMNYCKELGIRIDISYMYSNPITASEIDIAIIIGNILDNSIEACKKLNEHHEIWGSISSDEQNIIIDIRNYANRFKHFETTKLDKKNHGYGLKSITHIANKYSGYAKFSFKNGVFTSFVILKN